MLYALLAALAVLYVRWPQDTAPLADIVRHNLTITENVRVRFGDDGFRFPDLVKATQLQLNHELKLRNIPFRYTLVDCLPVNVARASNASHDAPTNVVPLTDGVAPTESAKAPEKVQMAVEMYLGDDTVIRRHPVDPGAMIMTYTLENVHMNDLPFYVAQTVIDHLLAADLSLFNRASYAGHSPTLDIHLVNVEDHGKANVTAELDELIGPFVDSLAGVTHITVHYEHVDVSKHRLPQQHIRDTPGHILFLYLTTLKGFLDSLNGKPVTHLEKRKKTSLIAAKLPDAELAAKSGVSVGMFADWVTEAVSLHIGLPKTDVSSVLKARALAKHLVLDGIHELLVSKRHKTKVYALIDDLLEEREHDWAAHLHAVTLLTG